MSEKSKYSRDIIVGSIGKISQLIGGYGTLWLLTDILTDTVYGGYVTALAVISLLTLLAQVGLRQATIQRVSELSAENEEAIPRHAGAAISWVGIAASAITGVTWFSSRFVSGVLDPAVISWIQALVFIIPGMAILPICGGVLRGTERVSTSIVLEQIAVQTLRLSGLTLAWFFWRDPIGVALVIGIAYYVPIIAFALQTHGWQYLNFSELSFSHLQYSGYLLVNSIVSKFLKETDILLLASLATLSGTGGYNVAWKIAIVARYGDQILTNTIQPRISRFLAKENVAKLRKEFDQVRDLSVLAAIPVLIVVLLFGDSLLNIFGSYSDQYNVLLILTIGAAINASFGKVGQILLMGKKGRLVLINTAIALGGNIALNILLIPQYGTLGAAIATTSTVFFLTKVVAVLQVRYFMNIKTFDPVTTFLVGILTFGVLNVVLGLLSVYVVAVLSIVVGSLLVYRRTEFIRELADDTFSMTERT